MDTREKIVSTETALALLHAGGWIAVAGYFDPMTAEEALRLASFADQGKVLGIVWENSRALLPDASRASLVASLREVSAVFVANREKWSDAIQGQTMPPVFEDLAGEQARREKFISAVLEQLRQK